MSNEIQLHSIGTLRGLLADLEGFSEKTPHNTVFLVSFEGLPVNLAEKRESELIIHEFQSFCHRKSASVFQVSQFEYAFLADVDAKDTSEKSAELKILVLSLIQNLYPMQFEEIDHSRTVRKLPLPERLDNFLAYVKNRHTEGLSVGKSDTGKHKLCEADLTELKAVFARKPPEEFAREFISRQTIFLAKDNEPLKPVAEEFFISMDAVKSGVLKNVDFRGNAALFNHMTVDLDQNLLRSLYHVSDRHLPMSINLNVQSVFSNEFKKFMELLGEKGLERIQIEFRQADILQHLSQYNLIGRILSKYQGSTVVDAVFPNTIGLIRMDRLSPSFVKIFWQSEGETDLRNRRADVDQIKKSGIFPVLARVDDEAGFKVGLELGIKLFQGFYFDALANNI